jgi:hypothetical protein
MSTVTAPSALIPTTREVGPLSDSSAWQVVLVDQSGRQVVLHNRARNEFSVRSSRWEAAVAAAGEEEEDVEELEVISQQQHSDEEGHSERSASPPPSLSVCPLCRRPTAPPPPRDVRSRRLPLTKDSNYFNLLSEANSLANTPRTTGAGGQQAGAGGKEGEPALDKTTLNSGYFGTFFEEIQLLGRGGAGSVHLVRHVLNGEQLGLYACKKGEVGSWSSSVVQMLTPFLVQSLLEIRRFRCSFLPPCLLSSALAQLTLALDQTSHPPRSPSPGSGAASQHRHLPPRLGPFLPAPRLDFALTLLNFGTGRELLPFHLLPLCPDPPHSHGLR